jgi:hypothetical protein
LLRISHIITLVSSNDNVCVLSNSLEVLVHGLTIYLQL